MLGRPATTTSLATTPTAAPNASSDSSKRSGTTSPSIPERSPPDEDSLQQAPGAGALERPAFGLREKGGVRAADDGLE